jgi:anthranilate synthase component 1
LILSGLVQQSLPETNMTETEFNALAAKGYNRISLMAETYADLDTPLSIYLKLAHSGPEGGRNSCLLESVVGGERFGRYSFIGLPAKTIIRATGNLTEVVREGKVVETCDGDPLTFIEAYQKRFKVALRPGMPRFAGGLAGYFGYETVRHIEPRLGASTKPAPGGEDGIPDILLLHVDELVVVDNLAGHTYLLVYADPQQPEAFATARRRIKDLREKLRMPVVIPYAYSSLQTESQRDFSKDDYIAAVRKAKDYIAAGDVMQVQIGQVITKPYPDSPLSLYRSLRSLNPSPYMYYWDFDNFHVVGSSPEILVRQEVVAQGDEEQTVVTIRPLAGTRRRGATPAEDAALGKELQADPKERAEHVMLIDLARNDMGRVAQTGTVKVTDTMTIERYSHVQHLVSNISGILKENTSNIDVLRATFPAGTLTGAPKVRAMEIIDELEPVRRGVYGGAAGYLSYSGEMDVAIAIRTGIVADSKPELEQLECENKARALFSAAEEALRYAGEAQVGQ